ncbi:N-acetyltransferase [Candidatus Chlorohelix allophototropha]|uniref:N-acetyltransferase n=2 Tax=Candidatus Chlorohelix allophototropha TaxID=3003348 RepID=A0ABY9B6B9_9CHLR|nr:N-acetyltransferase [Chloroflexota bacterium L227-S17]
MITEVEDEMNHTSEALGKNGAIVIRRARMKDVPQIFNLVNQMARLKNNLLPRSMSELYEYVRDFIVAADGDKVIGTCSLHIFWEDLAEVRSLAVDVDYQGQRLGEHLMKAIIEDARQLQILRLFTLTTIPVFFERFGFREGTKEQLPQKTWSECFRCPKFTACDETGLLLDLAPGYVGPMPVRALPTLP